MFGDVFWWQGIRSPRRFLSCSHRGLRHAKYFLYCVLKSNLTMSPIGSKHKVVFDGFFIPYLIKKTALNIERINFRFIKMAALVHSCVLVYLRQICKLILNFSCLHYICAAHGSTTTQKNRNLHRVLWYQITDLLQTFTGHWTEAFCCTQPCLNKKPVVETEWHVFTW